MSEEFVHKRLDELESALFELDMVAVPKKNNSGVEIYDFSRRVLRFGMNELIFSTTLSMFDFLLFFVGIPMSNEGILFFFVIEAAIFLGVLGLSWQHPVIATIDDLSKGPLELCYRGISSEKSLMLSDSLAKQFNLRMSAFGAAEF